MPNIQHLSRENKKNFYSKLKLKKRWPVEIFAVIIIPIWVVSAEYLNCYCSRLLFCSTYGHLECVQSLPVPETKRIISSAKLRIPIYMQFIKQQLVIIAGELPYNLKTDKRITKKLLKEAKPVIRKPSPLEEALKYAEVLKEPSIVSKAQVGARFGVSRARVCQMLNLIDLDHDIQKYLLSIENVKEHNCFTEKRLRQIVIIKDNNEQLRKFGELVDDIRFELNDEIN